jgi:hypothetical protein
MSQYLTYWKALRPRSSNIDLGLVVWLLMNLVSGVDMLHYTGKFFVGVR